MAIEDPQRDVVLQDTSGEPVRLPDHDQPILARGQPSLSSGLAPELLKLHCRFIHHECLIPHPRRLVVAKRIGDSEGRESIGRADYQTPATDGFGICNAEAHLSLPDDPFYGAYVRELIGRQAVED